MGRQRLPPGSDRRSPPGDKATSVAARPRVVEGAPVTIEDAVLELLPELGSIEVQRDTPGLGHPLHAHPTSETLLVVRGSITFHYGSERRTCTSGHRLLLPSGVAHSSEAGPEGCVYVIASHDGCRDEES
jgi:mannose-6-phosphate isomerase-like protein (cupin superfamily)